MSYPKIQWDLIPRALAWYTQRGYTYVEVPWLVSDKAVNLTMPEGHEGHKTKDGCLVGSAEQSFIQMLMDRRIREGKYVAVTPCFRDDALDDTHQRYFMKVELIKIVGHSIHTLNQDTANLASDALSFFHWVVPAPGAFVTRKTPQGYDIELNGVEIGSYGHRDYVLVQDRMFDFNWVYGTGLALPRFNVATETRPR